MNLREALRSFYRLSQGDRPQLLLVFLDRSPEVEECCARVRESFTRALGQPVIVVFGPRSMDHYADLFRSDLRLGLCLIVTAEPAADLAVPGAHYTFGQLKRALALGEFESLVASGQWVIRLHLSGDSGEALTALEALMEQALPR